MTSLNPGTANIQSQLPKGWEILNDLSIENVEQKLKENTDLYKSLLKDYLTCPEHFKSDPIIAKALSHLSLDLSISTVTTEIIESIQKINEIWLDKTQFLKLLGTKDDLINIYVALSDQKRLSLANMQDEKGQYLIDSLKAQGLTDLVDLLHKHKIYTPQERNLAAIEWIKNAREYEIDILPPLDKNGPLLSWDELIKPWAESLPPLLDAKEKKLLNLIAEAVSRQHCRSSDREIVFKILQKNDPAAFKKNYEKALSENLVEALGILHPLMYPSPLTYDEFQKNLMSALYSHNDEAADYLVDQFRPTSNDFYKDITTIIKNIYQEKTQNRYADPLWKQDSTPFMYLIKLLPGSEIDNLTVKTYLFQGDYLEKTVEGPEKSFLQVIIDELANENVFENYLKNNRVRPRNMFLLARQMIISGAHPSLEQWKKLISSKFDPQMLPIEILIPEELQGDLLYHSILRSTNDSIAICSKIKEILPKLPMEKAVELLPGMIEQAGYQKWDSILTYLLTYCPLQPNTTLQDLVDPILKKTVGSDKDSIKINLEKNEAIQRNLKRAEFLRTGKSSPTELAVKSGINIKNLAHFMGDQYIRGLGLEGNQFSTSTNFIQNLLAYFIDTNMTNLSPDQLASLDRCINSFKQFEEASLQQEKIGNGDNLKEISTLLDDYDKKWTEKIKRLGANDSLLLPFGWSNTKSPGHAMLLQISKANDNEITIRVYNTGGGTEYHPGFFDKQKTIVNTVRSYRLRIEDVETSQILRLLAEPKIIYDPYLSGKKRDEFDANKVYSILETCSYLQSESNLSEEEMSLWMSPQFSGTCTMKCLFAYLKNTIGDKTNKQFKTFGLLTLSRLALEDKNLGLKDYRLRMILERAKPDLFRKYAKDALNVPYNEEHVKLAQELSLNLQKALDLEFADKTTTYIPPEEVMKLPPSMKSRGSGIDATKENKEVSLDRKSNIPFPNRLNTFESANQIIDYVQRVNDYVSQSEVDPKIGIWTSSQTLIDIGKIILPTDFEKSILYSVLTPELRSKLCESLTKLAYTTYKLGSSNRPKMLTHLSLYYAQVMAWKLMLSDPEIGQFLNKHSLDIEEITDFLHPSASLASILSVEDYKNLKFLIDSKNKIAQSGPPLFDFNDMLETVSAKKLRLKPSSTELMFLSKFKERYPERFAIIQKNALKEWERIEPECRSDLDKFLGSKSEKEQIQKNEKLSDEQKIEAENKRKVFIEGMVLNAKSEYLRFFEYQNLPAQFNNLRSLALMAHTQDPFTAPYRINIETFLTQKPQYAGLGPNGQLTITLTAKPDSTELIDYTDSIVTALKHPKRSLTPYAPDIRQTKTALMPENIRNNIVFSRTISRREQDEEEPNEIVAGYRASKDKDIENSVVKDLQPDNQKKAYLHILASLKESNEKNVSSQVGESSPISIYLALEYYSNNLDLLKSTGEQYLFQRRLFLENQFGLELSTHPQLLVQSLEFFEKAIRHYQRLLEGNFDPLHTNQTLCFLLQEKMRLLSFSKGLLDNKDIDSEIEQTNTLIDRYLSMDQFQKEEHQQRLLLAKIFPYESEKKPDIEKGLTLLNLMMRFQRIVQKTSPNDLYLNWDEHDRAENILRKFSKVFEEFFAKDTSSIRPYINSLIHDYGLTKEGCEKININYPRIDILLSNGSTFSINLLDGQSKINGESLAAIPMLILLDPTFNAYIKDVQYSTKAEDTIYGADRFGEFRVIFNPVAIDYNIPDMAVTAVQRKIGDKWYNYSRYTRAGQYIKKYPEITLPRMNNKKLIHLASADEENTEIVYASQKNDKIVPQYIYRNNKDGALQCTFGDDNETYTNMSIPRGSFMNAFSYQASLWTRTSANNESFSRLILPGTKLKNDANINFRSGSVNIEGKLQQRWFLDGEEQLMIASEQKIRSLSGVSSFLILENPQGQKFALIRILYSPLSNIQFNCMMIEIKDGWLAPKDPDAAAVAAYLSFQSAAGVEDYKRTLNYLKATQDFGPLSRLSMSYLNKIIQEDSSYFGEDKKVDNSVEAASIRIFAATIIEENLKMHAPNGTSLSIKEIEEIERKVAKINKKIKNEKKSSKAIEEFIKQKSELIKKRESIIKDNEEFLKKITSTINKVIEKEFIDYISRHNQLDVNLRLTNHLPRLKLLQFIGRYKKAIDIIQDPNKKNFVFPIETPQLVKTTSLTLKDFQQQLLVTKYKAEPVYLKTAPDKKLYFWGCLAKAQSSAKQRKELKYFLWQLKDDPVLLPVRNILLAVIAATDAKEKGESIRADDAAILNLANQLIDPLNLTEKLKYQFNSVSQQLFELAKNYIPHIAHTTISTNLSFTSKVRYPEEIIGTPAPFKLPEKVPEQIKIKIAALPSHNSYNNNINADLDTLLTLTKTSQETKTFRHFEPPASSDKYLRETINDLNKDYEKGSEKNLEMPTFLLKADQESLSNFLNNKKLLLQKQDIHLKTLETAILALANKLPKDERKAFIEKNRRLAGQTKELTIDDCIFLYQQDHLPRTQKYTFLSKEEIEQLHSFVAQYMIASLERNDTKKLVDTLKGVENPTSFSTLDKFNLAQKLGQILTNKQQFDFNDPRIPKIILVFQYYLDMRLRKHQVDGLLNMLAKDPDGNLKLEKWMLQRIQGGGKTLVFGHIMAMGKADGYHLSIHVSPTPQYVTNLYDMRTRSGRIYRQTERTFTFDDSPEKYAPEYLKTIKTILFEAIESREYITLTRETLQSMRCKYAKQRLQLNDKYDNLKLKKEDLANIQKGIVQIPGITPEKAAELISDEEKLTLLEDLLSILRDRGVFTFDEVQIAFNPKVILNMPYGNPIPPNPLEISLIGKIVTFANNAKDDKGRSLLHLELNRQSQQTAEDYELMMESIVNQLFSDPNLVKDLSIGKMTRNEKEEIRAYLKTENASTPQFITEKYPDTRSNWILLRMLIGGKWLQDRFKQSVNEHCGLSSDKKGPEIAIPYTANMDALEGSEFSNIYVTIINTMLTFFANGLTHDQIIKVIESLQKKAMEEYQNKQVEHPDMLLSETDVAKSFEKLINFNLFQVNAEDTQTLESIEKKLRDGYSISMELILDYMKDFVFPKVNYYPKLVSSNGQNVASMGKSFVGYSGSFDNVYISPIGSKFDLDFGTNGQTVDRLIDQNDDVFVTPTSPVETVEMMLKEHPHRKQIRALIDIGCLFRGYKNIEAAEIIANSLKAQDSKIKGVLFFNQEGQFCYMSCNKTSNVRTLSGTTPEVIAAETGLLPHQLFTYYDQKHITGTDILQADDTYAIATISEHTQIHELLQGARRLRALDFGQRLIPTVQQSALHKFSSYLGKDFSGISFGRPDPKRLNISDLILYTHILEKVNHLDENDMVTIQKMTDLATQCVLDKVYKTKDLSEKRDLFNKTKNLFTEDITVDLISQYGSLLVDEKKEVFLNSIRDNLLAVLKTAGISDNELKNISTRIQSDVIDPIIDHMRPTIKVAQNDVNSVLKKMGMESTMTQHRQQEAKREVETQQQNVQVQQQIKVSENINLVDENIQLADYLYMSKEDFSTLSFIDVKSLADAGKELENMGPLLSHYVYSLQDVLNKQLNSKDISFEQLKSVLGPDILLSRNLIQTFEKRIDLLTANSKPRMEALVIADLKDKEHPWKIILGSPLDGALWKKYLETPECIEEIKKQNKMAWVVTSGMKETTTGIMPLYECLGKGPSEDVLMPFFLLTGQLKQLNNQELLRNWLNSPEKRTAVRELFENYLLNQFSPQIRADYIRSNLYKILHENHQLTI